MTITRIGATKNYANNWEAIFGGGTKKKVSKATAKTKSAKKKSTKKKAAKKSKAAKAAKPARRKK
jgi:hypothetical protein